mgnify:CR=1 FL=1
MQLGAANAYVGGTDVAAGAVEVVRLCSGAQTSARAQPGALAASVERRAGGRDRARRSSVVHVVSDVPRADRLPRLVRHGRPRLRRGRQLVAVYGSSRQGEGRGSHIAYDMLVVTGACPLAPFLRVLARKLKDRGFLDSDQDRSPHYLNEEYRALEESEPGQQSQLLRLPLFLLPYFAPLLIYLN